MTKYKKNITFIIFIATLALNGNALTTDDFSVARLCGVASDGTQIANPDDCGSYYTCSAGSPKLEKCGSGKSFDKDKQSCESPSDSSCGKNNFCSGHRAGTKVEDPLSCNRFYYCDGFSSTGILGQCEGDLSFIDGECGNNGGCDRPVEQGYCLVLPNNKFFGDADDCEKWQGCDNGVYKSGTCGGYFDTKTEKCTYDDSKCAYSPKKDESCIDGDFVADSSSCSRYLICFKKFWIRQECPSGKFFEMSKKECVSRFDSTCKINRCNNDDGFNFVNNLRTPGCKSYTLCKNNEPSETLICANDQYFDEKLQKCSDVKPSYTACNTPTPSCKTCQTAISQCETTTDCDINNLPIDQCSEAQLLCYSDIECTGDNPCFGASSSQPSCKQCLKAILDVKSGSGVYDYASLGDDKCTASQIQCHKSGVCESSDCFAKVPKCYQCLSEIIACEKAGTGECDFASIGKDKCSDDQTKCYRSQEAGCLETYPCLKYEQPTEDPDCKICMNEINKCQSTAGCKVDKDIDEYFCSADQIACYNDKKCDDFNFCFYKDERTEEPKCIDCLGAILECEKDKDCQVSALDPSICSAEQQACYTDPANCEEEADNCLKTNAESDIQCKTCVSSIEKCEKMDGGTCRYNKNIEDYMCNTDQISCNKNFDCEPTDNCFGVPSMPSCSDCLGAIIECEGSTGSCSEMPRDCTATQWDCYNDNICTTDNYCLQNGNSQTESTDCIGCLRAIEDCKITAASQGKTCNLFRDLPANACDEDQIDCYFDGDCVGANSCLN